MRETAAASPCTSNPRNVRLIARPRPTWTAAEATASARRTECLKAGTRRPDPIRQVAPRSNPGAIHLDIVVLMLAVVLIVVGLLASPAQAQGTYNLSILKSDSLYSPRWGVGSSDPYEFYSGGPAPGEMHLKGLAGRDGG